MPANASRPLAKLRLPRSARLAAGAAPPPPWPSSTHSRCAAAGRSSGRSALVFAAASAPGVREASSRACADWRGDERHAVAPPRQRPKRREAAGAGGAGETTKRRAQRCRQQHRWRGTGRRVERRLPSMPLARQALASRLRRARQLEGGLRRDGNDGGPDLANQPPNDAALQGGVRADKDHEGQSLVKALGERRGAGRREGKRQGAHRYGWAEARRRRRDPRR